VAPRAEYSWDEDRQMDSELPGNRRAGRRPGGDAEGGGWHW
jgi:hypothetical protein